MRRMDGNEIIRAIPELEDYELIGVLHAAANEVEARMLRPPREVEYPTDGDGHKLPW
ncbi:MAG: hypothetical protein IJ153_10295 [Clostridia bacterium]|nr:hypothetical protein [Clostridia bacterium]